MEKIVDVAELTYAYGEKKVLDNVSLQLYQGEIVAIVGTSGSGKTTLFNLIAGVLQPQTGTITIRGNQEPRGKVSYMLQKDLLLEHKTVIDNIILPLQLKKITKSQAILEAQQLLLKFGLDSIQDKYPHQLSGGMRQRVALLRTYMFKQSIFLLDEAFSALDALTKINVHEWFLQAHHELGLSTIMITHDLDEAMLLSDRIYILGGTPANILKEVSIDKSIKEDPMKRHLLKQDMMTFLK